MAPDRKRVKSESLSLRLDPKTKFILDFLSRLRGQSITTVVERAIKEAADQAGIGPKWDNRGNEIAQHNWTHFWDASEGVRTLKLLADSEYPTTFDEDELRQFTLGHWPFFYVQSDGTAPKRGYVDILWPRIAEFVEKWRDIKSENYWAVGEEMASALRAAKVAPPENWPPQVTKASLKPSKALDDDIPF